MDHLVSLFEQMDSPYMQARASDVRAISDRMLRILTGRGAVPPVSFSPSILVSTEFAPSQIITLDRSCILGFIAMRGSVQSHAAALSRALSIPALVKLDLSASLEGHTAFLTGQNSCHHFCQLCLAAAVDAGNSQDFTAVEGKGNIL